MRPCVCFCRPALASCLPAGVIVAPPSAATGKLLLCAIAPDAVGQLSDIRLLCRTLLVPEGQYRPLWRAEQAVGYGLDGHSSLTLSSIGSRPMLCIQRSFSDLSGSTVEMQELALPRRWATLVPQEQLFLAGVWLLGGSLP